MEKTTSTEIEKLNEHHVQHIEQFLTEEYKLYFIDIRTEVVDHIASEIEVELNTGQTYQEAFINTFTVWDRSLRASKFFYKGVPKFIAKQWVKDKLLRFSESIAFGLLSIIGIAFLFNLLKLTDNSIQFAYTALLITSGSIFLIIHIINYHFVSKTICKTARGQFLRLEVKRDTLINIIAIANLIAILSRMLHFEYTLELSLFFMLTITFNKIQWYIQYNRAKILEIKWQSIV